MTTILIRWAVSLVSALSIVFWAFVAYRLLRYPENHVGWNVLYATILFGLLAALAGASALLSGDRWAPGLLVYAVLSGLGIVLMYRYNVLIPYEVWLDRGMPPRPF